MAHKTRSLKWFKTRIGKRIFRDDDQCCCDTCKKIVEEGLIIEDEAMAKYLYTVQNDFAFCGVYLNYRDEK